MNTGRLESTAYPTLQVPSMHHLATFPVNPAVSTSHEHSKYEPSAVHEHKGQIYVQKAHRPTTWKTPMDNMRAPSLAAKSLDLQTREIFNTLVSTILFPATYAAFYKRVDQDIIAFVRDDRRAQCPNIEWLVRCYATWYFAKKHNDEEKLAESRYIYGVLLRYLRVSLEDPRRRIADTTFATALLLAVYEVLDGRTPDGWLVHMTGIKGLLRLRGPAAHYRGIGRTLFLACRGFFIAEAFANQEECILAEPDWVNVSARAFEREERAGRGSTLVSIIDQAYREAVLVPGLVAQARSIRLDDGVRESESKAALCTQIKHVQGALQTLTRQLNRISSREEAKTGGPGRAREGFIDSRYTASIARYNLQGLCAIEALLDQVLPMLDAAKPPTKQDICSRPVSTSPSLRRQVPAGAAQAETDSSLLERGNLDDMFLSMGAMAICMDR
ncbi:hypothetical protein ASPVEDRAFT_45260 [Aspergillus versicolor CBS 583.65]|uniref:Transcription factor domain-containing protein n=1 Tax=Aspergillus versicolor CBS 583.65 TaxID=1036611 RepID=A0A1L9PWE5_ASPVE|nr:uncharacterized protein ASPVEDRAFT_45260 [Aspergillus versicolor CBS 583.65]OJJ05756.1 hypothetical protein ASPVEDRAFT_45260 [Aspergillus versicolor CBS 583.65]